MQRVRILIVHFFNYTQEKDLGKQRKAWGSLMRFCLVARSGELRGKEPPGKYLTR